MSILEQRKIFKVHNKECNKLRSEWASRGYMPAFPTYPDIPEDLKDLRWGL